MPETTYIAAITSTLAAAMRADERVFVSRRGRRRGRAVHRHGRARRGVRNRARDQHADQRGRDHRRRHRRGAVGLPPGARDHVRRLHHARARPARQRGREGALHVRRPADGADGAAHAGRRRPARRGAALAEPGELADARARPQGGDAEPSLRRGGAARLRDRRPESRRLHREQDAVLPQGRCPRAGAGRADRRGRDAARRPRRHRRRPLAPRPRRARRGGCSWLRTGSRSR